MSWDRVKLRDLEKVFNGVFNPESLYGLQAFIYDEAVLKSNHFGTTWKEEMENVSESTYFDFIVDVLEEEGITSDDFNKK